MDGMKSIRYFSLMNEWLDFVVIVPDGFVDDACKVIKSAMDLFWDDQYETYGDAVETELALADIPFEIHDMPWDHEKECAIDEAAWEKWIEELAQKHSMTNLH